MNVPELLPSWILKTIDIHNTDDEQKILDLGLILTLFCKNYRY